MSPIAQTTEPPMAWPVVTIGARSFVVKFNQRAEYLASLWGYNLSELVSVINPNNTDPRRTAWVFQLFAACTGHNFSSAQPPQKPLTAEEWMDFIESVVPQVEVIGTPNEETALGKVYAAIGTAVMGAVVKRWSDRKTNAAPSPTIEMPAAQKEPVQ